MQKLNRGDEAKESFLEALSLDVKCYDAFQKLVDSQMMTPDEGADYTLRYRAAIDRQSTQSGTSSNPSPTHPKHHTMLNSCN